MKSTEISSRLLVAKNSIEAARSYVLSLLEGLNDDEWFWMPATPATHIAWQVGHIAYAQYGLLLYRQRGRRREDAELMSTRFRKQFAKGSVARPREDTIPLDEIRSAFEGIFEQSIKELASLDELALDEPVELPYFGFSTRYGCLLMATHHEMIHAGQIGMLRRMMGKDPVR